MPARSRRTTPSSNAVTSAVGSVDRTDPRLLQTPAKHGSRAGLVHAGARAGPPALRSGRGLAHVAARGSPAHAPPRQLVPVPVRPPPDDLGAGLSEPHAGHGTVAAR